MAPTTMGMESIGGLPGRMKTPGKAAVAADAGARLRQLRDLRGLTREVMAPMIKVETRALGNYESGLRMLPPEVAIRVAQLFGVTTDWLYWGRTSGLPHELFEQLSGGSRPTPEKPSEH